MNQFTFIKILYCVKTFVVGRLQTPTSTTRLRLLDKETALQRIPTHFLDFKFYSSPKYKTSNE